MLVAVLEACEERPTPIQQLLLNEPLHLFPFYWQKLFTHLEDHGTEVKQLPEPTIEGNHDLAIFQKALKGDIFFSER